jgi:hypothetical protein
MDFKVTFLPLASAKDSAPLNLLAVFTSAVAGRAWIQGDTINIICEGAEAAEALKALENVIVNEGLGEILQRLRR